MATTTTDLSTLTINYLSESAYNSALSNGTINENELYMTPMSSNIILKSIDIPASGWASDSTSGFYKITINNSSVTTNDVVEINLNLSSITIAENCGLKSVVESASGKIYLYAKSTPTGSMTGTMVIIKG